MAPKYAFSTGPRLDAIGWSVGTRPCPLADVRQLTQSNSNEGFPGTWRAGRVELLHIRRLGPPCWGQSQLSCRQCLRQSVATPTVAQNPAYQSHFREACQPGCERFPELPTP